MFGASQDKVSRCQSCGMELSIHNFGTNASSSMNFEYCRICFQMGVFTDPDCTLSQMIENTALRMVDQDTTFEEAKHEMEKIIPHLKRWRNTK